MAIKRYWWRFPLKVPRVALGVAVAGCLALAGCAELEPDNQSPIYSPPSATTPATTVPEASPKAPAARSKRWPPLPKSKPEPASPDTDSAVPPQAALPAADNGSQPLRLSGKDEQEVTSLLGEPGDRHEAAPAKVWRYTSSACELELYFYLDVASNRFQVLQIRVDQIVSSPTVTQQCLESILDERQSR